MATAVGTYATLANLKTRLGITDTTDDAVLQTIVDQTNSLIEGITGRVLAPIPAFSTTVAVDAAAAATSITLTTASGLSVGDAIMLGQVSGTHEHAIVAAINGAVVTLQYATTNAYVATTTVQRIQIFDGFDAYGDMRMFPVPNGIVSATSVEVATYTNGPYYSIPMTDIALRPQPLDREPGWPATELWMVDIPSSSNPQPLFFRGRWTVRVVGSFGWPAIPDEIVDIALTTATRAWLGRQSGQTDTVGSDTLGRPVISRYLSARDRDTLGRYQSKMVEII